MREASHVAVRHAPGSESLGGPLRREVGEHRVSAGGTAPTVFHHPGWKVRVVVHGDDFTVSGKQQHLDMVKTEMRELYIITVKGVMGPDAGECKDMCILNWRLKVEGEFLIYEPDPKHAKILCEETGLKEDSKGLGAPVARENAAATGTEEEPLGQEETTRFLALAARANYIAQEWADVHFAAKGLYREMLSPVASSWLRLKRFARYMLEYPSAEWRFPMESDFKADVLDVHSDWAGSKATRKSTLGGMLVVDGCCLRSWSSTQATATSSGEAELHALVKAAVEGLGFQACDLGVELRVELWVDSSTAQSISSKNEVGKTKHVEVKVLWIQKVVQGSRIVVQGRG